MTIILGHLSQTVPENDDAKIRRNFHIKVGNHIIIEW